MSIQHPMAINVNTRMRWSVMEDLPFMRSCRGKRVLDLAAGLGYLGDCLAQRGADVLTADIHAPSVEYIATNLGLKTRVMDLEQDDYPAGPFDIVLLCEVLEHLHHPERAVGKAAEIISPGGTLLISTPANEGFLTRTPGKQLGHAHGAEKHERDGFHRHELEDILLRAGLRIQGHRYCVFYTSELFMQLTKLVYLLKGKPYLGQSDILGVTRSFSYKALSIVYPALHQLFTAEDKLMRKLGRKGHCHVIWAVKP